jgi:peptidoglycan/LPS O-acetylase OafA/YrhL
MKINYKPEIDGLRAIAVGAVILYHAEIIINGNSLFKGGFVGVDIFFVISGYLITFIILKELINTQSFSFKHFYEKRIRRVIPVLLFIILASIPIAWICLTPINLIDFAKSILFSLGFTSNLYFYFSGQEYGALSGLFKPLLHTWSLSIEEQFYIIFPLIIFVIHKYFKKKFLLILTISAFVSLLFAQYGSKNFATLNFYILPSRAWELIFGAILAFTEIQNKYFDNSLKKNFIYPKVGIIFIGYSILFFKSEDGFPSLNSVIPVLGTILIIAYSNKDELITKILSSKFFVRIGLLSYSLYLWHYPIFAFGRITEITSGSLFKKILLGCIILILSIFSYFFIERPFRNKKYSFKIIMITLFIISFVIIFISSLIIQKNGFKTRMPSIMHQITLEETHNLLRNSKNQKCLLLSEGCSFNSSSKNKIFIIGDSHAASLAFDLKKRVLDKNYNFITSFLGDCGFFLGFNLIDVKSKKIDEKCNDLYFNNLLQKIKSYDNSIIIISARFPLYLSNQELNEGANKNKYIEWKRKYIPVNKFKNVSSSFRSTFNEISQKNKIILIYPTPEYESHVPRKLFNKFLKENLILNKNSDNKDLISIPYNEYRNRTKLTFELFDSIEGKNIYRVYPHKLFCNTLIKNKCIAHDYEKIYYFDNNHLSIYGASIVNDLIINEINKIYSK